MALRINLRKIRPGYILKPRGKNLKFVYYVRCGLRHFVPSFWLRRHKAELLETLDARTDKEQILDRVNYYNKQTGIRELSGLTHVSDVTNSNGTYNCDAFEFTRYFSPDLLLDKHFGDWTTICETPSIVKTRPLSGDTSNNVILNLDKVRHFVFLKDKRTFASKWDKVKWVMSSNSVAVMPRPKYESWFMEGRLQPGVHYIEIKDDYSDLEDKIQYYSTHVEEAEAIIRNAHAFVEQFRDKEREELISILVLEKYFRHTKQ